MSETKFTPGPWIIRTEGSSYGRWPVIHTPGPYYEDGGEFEVAELGCTAQAAGGGKWESTSDSEVITANALLIAAAPELYAEHYEDDQLLMQMATVILNEKIADYVPCGMVEKVRDRLRRGTPAIAKARGEGGRHETALR